MDVGSLAHDRCVQSQPIMIVDKDLYSNSLCEEENPETVSYDNNHLYTGVIALE